MWPRVYLLFVCEVCGVLARSKYLFGTNSDARETTWAVRFVTVASGMSSVTLHAAQTLDVAMTQRGDTARTHRPLRKAMLHYQALHDDRINKLMVRNGP
jgi:hypothetical protein